MRFAPSPTNNNQNISQRGLHVGSIRTALYNYVWAKKNNIPFIMRLEDTDVTRSNDECLECIVRDFKLAGIQFDAGFDIRKNKVIEYNNTKLTFGSLRQSKRQDIHNKYIDVLLKKNKAYEKDGAIYFKSDKKNISFIDGNLGEIKFNGNQLEDFVIRKSSGISSFYLACTLDDHDMSCRTVIRGAEHINTTPKQVQIQQALGLNSVNYIHIPLILNPDKSKMSKRQTTDQVNFYEFIESGFLPESIINYLALLGWGSDKEIFDIDYLLENFDIKDLGKTNAVYDKKKLEFINGRKIADMDKNRFLKQVKDYGSEFYPEFIDKARENFPKIAEAYQERSKTLSDLFENGRFFVDNNISFNEKDAKKTLLNNNMHGLMLLEDVEDHLYNLYDWTLDLIKESLEDFCQLKNIGMGKIAQPLRLALTGSLISPPIDQTLEILGRSNSIERIARCVNTFKPVGVQ